MSVHKVQGMTINSLTICDIRKFWCSQQLYVAISRVTNEDKIQFLQPDDRPNGFLMTDLYDTIFKYGSIADNVMREGIRLYYHQEAESISVNS